MAVSYPRIVGPISLGHGANEFFSIVLPPVIPLLVADLDITYAEAGFLLTIFFVMYSIFQLPAGVLADWIGKRRLLIVGLAGMALGVFFASTATGYGMLLVAQTIAGISGSTFHPTGMSIISDLESRETEGKAMGVFGFGGALGTLASPVIIGGLAAVAGWRIALAAAGVLGLAIAVAFIPLLRAEAIDSSESGGTDSSQSGDERSLAAGLRSLRALVAAPNSRGVAILFFVTLTLSMQHRAIHTFTTSYVVAETGASISFGNLVFFILLLGGSLSSLWAGELADRVDRVFLGGSTAIATALLVGATILLASVLQDLPTWAIYGAFSVWFFVIGVMMYAAYPVKNALISQHAETTFSGSLFGVIQTASALGSATGPALFGILSTEWGVIAAFPAIGAVSLTLAALFFLLSRTT